ncbi:MAG: sulfate adenylyltransferase, partial [Dehalococcoidia bacterium]
AIETPEGEVDEAPSEVAVTVRIADDLDISRGDVLCAAGEPPSVTQEFEATVCWMSERSELRAGAMLRVKHATRTARAMVVDLLSRMDVTSLDAEAGVDALRLNEIGRVTIRTSTPLVCDDYVQNRTTGSFILVDEATNNTVAAGMIGAPRFGDALLAKAATAP